MDSRFCVFCGTWLEAGGVPSNTSNAPAEVLPPDNTADPEPQFGDSQPRAPEIEEIKRELGEATRLLSRLQSRIANLESAGRPARQAQTPPAGPSGSQSRQPEADASTQPATPLSRPYPTGANAPPEIPRYPIRPPVWSSIDWEQVLGRNWFAIIGAVALTFGVGFFLKLAIDNDWISPTGRVALGVAVGVALLGTGEYSHRKIPLWAAPVTAAGLAILYLSIYAGFGRYDLIDPLPALLSLGGVAVLGTLLALRHESLTIALLSILGAFTAPLLLGRDLPDERLLLPYILVVDVGVLALSTFRNWRWFTLVAMSASYILFLIWVSDNPGDHVILGESGLVGVFLVFVSATSLFHVLWRRDAGSYDLALMTINAAAFFGLTFELLWTDYASWFGGISLSLSLFYCAMAYTVTKRAPDSPQLALFSLSIAVIFLTVAMPLQLSGSWVTVAWAAEGAVLIWLGFLLGRLPLRLFGLGILAISAGRLLVLDSPVELVDFNPVLNNRFPPFVVAIAAFYAAAYAYHRYRDRLDFSSIFETAEPSEVHMFPVLLAAANLLTLWLLSAEAIAFFDSHTIADQWRDGEHDKFLTLTALWAVYAMGLMAVASVRRSGLLPWAAAVLLLVVTVKFLLIDTFEVEPSAGLFSPVLNFYFLAYLILLAVLIFSAFAYRREFPNFPGMTRVWPLYSIAIIVAANVISIWALSVEAYRYFNHLEFNSGDDYSSAMQLTLTLIWSIYAVGTIAVGIIARSSYVRLAGIALLALPVVKLFIFDVFLMELGYRVVAFIALGGLLLAMGLVYQRYSHAVRGFLFGQKTRESHQK
ncbi:MAG: DUF2339 domain-containing protein [Chloroflexi bacterium]|nr:DUF2339 domain-containing protein [Chloroflexota bacterium]MDA1270112.1 DUF2339 domain-containing protein [Chloroflexota bacterium]